MNISKRLKAAESAVFSDVMEICNTAKQQEDAGEYVDAARSMGEWWRGVGIRPDVDKLSAGKKAAILSRVGALSGWMGSMQQIPESQEKAKDLISEGANLFEAIHDLDNWAEARSDLAVCYWREGALDEARIVLNDVLGGEFNFSPELKSKILLRFVTVEVSAMHYETASVLINQVASLMKKKENPLLLGKFYFYRAFITRRQAEEKNQLDLLTSSIEDYHLAAEFYQKVGHLQFIASVEINLGYVFLTLNRYIEAHSHFDAALEILAHQKDKRLAASVYDNKARTFIAQGKLSDAELAALTSVNMLKEGGEASVLAESLTTLAIVLNRGGNIDKAIDTFNEAKDTALVVGDSESAGNAVLTYIEELQAELTPIVFRQLFLEASELLENSPKRSNAKRLLNLVIKHFEKDNPASLLKKEKYFNWKNFCLPKAINNYERELILKALTEAGGRVTKAASLLGVSHQNLSIAMHQRHKDLQQFTKQRKPRGTYKIKKRKSAT
jgi:tetratricopeptide (TPR) repeat protein